MLAKPVDSDDTISSAEETNALLAARVASLEEAVERLDWAASTMARQLLEVRAATRAARAAMAHTEERLEVLETSAERTPRRKRKRECASASSSASSSASASTLSESS